MADKHSIWLYWIENEPASVDPRATRDPAVAELFRQSRGYVVTEYIERDWADGEGQEGAEAVGDEMVRAEAAEKRCKELEQERDDAKGDALHAALRCKELEEALRSVKAVGDLAAVHVARTALKEGK